MVKSILHMIRENPDLFAPHQFRMIPSLHWADREVPVSFDSGFEAEVPIVRGVVPNENVLVVTPQDKTV